jgi:hypothetical protein
MPMSGSRRDRGLAPNESAAGSRWSLLLPWGVLPLALAIVTLADWLHHRRRHTPPKEAA